MKEDIRVAEWWYTERKKTKLLMLSDGTQVYKEDAPAEDILAAAGIMVVAERDTLRKTIKWAKLTGMEVLEEQTWAGKYIPIVPVYGQQIVVDDKRKKYGLVRMAKDPQRMYNYWRTALTESVALAPKAKWLLAEGQDEGHENEWAQANVKATPVLRYKQKDIEGQPAPQPTRLQPEPPPAGIVEATSAINNDLQTVVGIFDPNQFAQGNMSGKAIRGQQMQIDLTNFHYYDNLTRSLKQTGRIILDLIPKIYDKERVMRIIGYDNRPEMVTINQRVVDEQGAEKILNDVTVGEYDVYMDTGPGYQSKRQEAVEAMVPLLQANPELFQAAGDLVFRNMDFPGADVIADRLAAMNPMAKIDEKSDIPPQVQMQLMASQKHGGRPPAADCGPDAEPPAPDRCPEDEGRRPDPPQTHGCHLAGVQHRDHQRGQGQPGHPEVGHRPEPHRTGRHHQTAAQGHGRPPTASRDCPQGRRAEPGCRVCRGRGAYQRLAIHPRGDGMAQAPVQTSEMPMVDDQLLAQLQAQQMQPQPLEQPAIPGVPMGPR
jgi:hypothetical protein